MALNTKVRYGTFRGDGTTYGTLPDKGFGVKDIRLVLHTTETEGMPGYNGGAFAPHWTCDIANFRWYQHAETDRRTGTMLGYSATGINSNEIAVQVEIICYSSKSIAAQSSKRLWVGDFTDKHYRFLADFVAMIRKEMGMALTEAYGPAKDFASFLYGKHDQNEMSHSQWYSSGGILTGHGAGPHQKHWDTGVLDLHRILKMSLGGNLTTTPMADWRRLFNQAEAQTFNSVVESVQYFLTYSSLDGTGPDAQLKRYYFGKVDGFRNAKTYAALKAWKVDMYGNPDAKAVFGSKAWNELNRQLYMAHVQSAPAGAPDCSAVQAELDEADSLIDSLEFQMGVQATQINQAKTALGCV